MSEGIEWRPNPGSMPCPGDMWVLVRWGGVMTEPDEALLWLKEPDQ